MAIYDLNGEEFHLKVGDILFYDTSKRWPEGFGPSSKADARDKKRALDNWLIRKLQGSPITHAAVVTRIDGNEVFIVDIVADRDVNEHEIREGQFPLEGTVLRPKGKNANDIVNRLTQISRAHVGDDNVGFNFSRYKTWGTKFFCCMAKAEKPYKEMGYGRYVLEELYQHRREQRWGHKKTTFRTYCAEYIAILLTLSIKEFLNDKDQLDHYEDWLNNFAEGIYRTTTTNLHDKLGDLRNNAPIHFDTYGWQNEYSLNRKKPELTEEQPLLAKI